MGGNEKASFSLLCALGTVEQHPIIQPPDAHCPTLIGGGLRCPSATICASDFPVLTRKLSGIDVAVDHWQLSVLAGR
jgi:hypothetical protein